MFSIRLYIKYLKIVTILIISLHRQEKLGKHNTVILHSLNTHGYNLVEPDSKDFYLGKLNNHQ